MNATQVLLLLTALVTLGIVLGALGHMAGELRAARRRVMKWGHRVPPS